MIKSVEIALRESEANLKAIIENSLESIWSIDTNYRILYVNEVFVKEFEQTFGVTLSIGSNILEALPGLLKTLWKERYDRAFNNEHFVFTDRIDLPGQVIYIEVAMNPILVEGTVIGASFYGKNITEQKNYELQLIAAKESAEISEEKFRLMIKNSNDSFVLVDKNGNQFYISDAAVRDTGFSVEELMGPIENVIYPEDLETVLNAWHEVLEKKGEVIRVQYRHKHKYKSYIWYEAAAQNFLDNPAIHAVVVNVRDITETKRTEQELIEAKVKAEESDRLKTAFLQNMSHEIRTPMNAIMGFTNLLVDSYNDKARLEMFSEIINNRCDDLLDILNDILDISKIEAGQVPVNYQVCNFDELFGELKSFFVAYQNRTCKNHIHLEFNTNLNADGVVYLADKIKLKQIFINLISNAFKFTETGRIEVGCRTNRIGDVVFHVSDTGMGIPAEKHEFIFKRFTQLNHSTTNNLGGTGLGLSIVKGLVELLDGNIWLESEPGLGSTFLFTIPLKTA